MTENLSDGIMMDIQEAEEKAAQDVMKQREEALAAELAAMKTRKRKLVDPLQFEMSIQDEDLANYVPTLGWEMAPPSSRQLQALENCGIYPDQIENAGKASLILDRLAKRRMEGLATPKQIRFLESRGFQHTGMWSFLDANRMIARISNNHWRIPNDVDPETYVPAGVNYG